MTAFLIEVWQAQEFLRKDTKANQMKIVIVKQKDSPKGEKCFTEQ